MLYFFRKILGSNVIYYWIATLFVFLFSGESRSQNKNCDTLLIPKPDMKVGVHYLSRIFLEFRSNYIEIIDSVRVASLEGSIETGISEIDSINKKFMLVNIDTVGGIFPFKEAFYFNFSEDINISDPAIEYCNLPYISLVLVEVFQPTSINNINWGRIKYIRDNR